MQKKSFMNFRIFVVLALSIIVASVFATYVFVSQISKLVAFIVLLVAFAVFLVIFIFKRRKLFACLTAVLLICAIPFISNYSKSKTLKSYEMFESEEVVVCGKVSERYKITTAGALMLTLSDVSIDYSGNVYSIDGNIAIYTNPNGLNLEDFYCGRIVTAKTTLDFCSLEKDISKAASNLTKDVVATGYSVFYDIEPTDKESLLVRDKLREAVYNKLESGDVKYYEIGYAMLFGESNVLDTGINNSFRATGIAHLIAVSGLNVSIIIGLISFVLKKLKVSNKIIIAFAAVVLGFYCYLCNFAVSVVRASLMAVFALYAVIRGKAYDNMSVLSLIAVLVLLISPLELFNLSFILSFLAVLSIILLMPPFERYFNNLYYKNISLIISLNLAVQVGLLATSVYYFGRYPLFGILANLVAVPIATLAFIVLLCGLVLSFVFPFMGFLNVLFGELMSVVVKFNTWIANFGIYLRFGSCSVVVIPLMILMMFIVSDYVFLSKKKKLIASSSLGLMALILVFV